MLNLGRQDFSRLRKGGVFQDCRTAASLAGLLLMASILFAGTSFCQGSSAALSHAEKCIKKASLPAHSVVAASHAHPQNLFARLPLSFEPNQGQTDASVKFLAHGPHYTLFLTSSGATLSFLAPNQGPSSSSFHPEAVSSWLHMELRGQSQKVRVAGLDELPGKSNYFIGSNPRLWRSGIPHYAEVRYQHIYPGIDLTYYGNPQQLEYDFTISPGANPERICFHIKGPSDAVPLRLDSQGNLLVDALGGEFRYLKPVAYQTIGAGKQTRRQSVKSRYIIEKNGDIRILVGPYNHRKNLIIDPTLVYSTYLGGSGSDSATGIAIDGSGNAFITGGTTSSNFPTSNPEQKATGGGSDVFVTELNPSGGSLVYSTYIGGSSFDKGTSIAIDSSGNAYVTGYTSSPNFPTTSKAFSTTYQGNGNSEAFALKLNSGGSALGYSTYLGGSGGDFGQGIAVDSGGNAYITGSTQSANFPVANAIQGTLGGGSDAFVTKLDPAGATLLYSTFLGGSTSDSGQAIAVDSAGEAYVTGFTFSTNFPTKNPLQSANNGGADAFVAKLNGAGSQLVFSTYLGGSGDDRGLGLTLNAGGNVFITGSTQSPNFPTTSGAYQTTPGGNTDAFIAQVNAAGSQLVYSTYLGGSDVDQGNGIGVDSAGNAYVIGSTASTNFPTQTPTQATLGEGACGSPCSNAFVAALNPQGSGLVYSTYLGGSGPDYGQAIAVDSSGNAYVVGSTASSNFPAVAGAFQPAYASSGISGNGFVAKISPQNSPAVALNPQKIDFGNQGLNVASSPQTVTLTNVGSAPLSISNVSTSANFNVQSNNCGNTVAAGGGQCTIGVTFTPTDTTTVTGNLSITDNAAGSPQQVSLSGTGATPAPVATFSPSTLNFNNQLVGTTSAPQTVTLTNTGSADLTITKITISGAFAETNNCPATLSPSQSCTISVTYSPTQTTGASSSSSSSSSTTDSNKGALSLTDNEKTPPVVNLNGDAVADFSLSSSGPSSTPIIGATSTTLTIAASALLSSFNSQISFSCASGTTCSFNPTSITPGQSTTMTVSGLSGSTSNPLNFTVTGTSGNQSATLDASIKFQDFSLSASPSLDTVTAGQSATYTVTLTPVNGFNQAVSLSCSSGLPAAASCSFSPQSVTLNGSSTATASLTVTTTAHSKGLVAPIRGRRNPPPQHPGSELSFGLLLAVLLLSLILAVWLRGPKRAWLALGALLLLALLLAGCNLGYYGFTGSNPAPTGSPSGVYTITISGSFSPSQSSSGQTGTSRSTTVNLAVQ